MSNNRADIVIKRNDVGKVISGQFKDADGVAVNCTGHTSRKIFMKKRGAATLKINSTFDFVNAASGLWSYILQASDVDTDGEFNLEFEVGLPGPQLLTFPTDQDHPYLIVLIQKDLG